MYYIRSLRFEFGNVLASGIMNVLPGIENASKVAKNAAATRVFKNIRSKLFLLYLDPH